MSDTFCEYESAVIRAARTDQWEPSLRDHAHACPVCVGALRVHRAMASLALTDQVPPMPDPKLIWLKAQFVERQRRSTIIARIAGVAFGGLAAALGWGIYVTTRPGLDATIDIGATSAQTTTSLPAISVMVVTVLIALLLSLPSPGRSGRA